MKLFSALLLFCLSLHVNAQQNKFLKIPKKGMEAPFFASSFAEIFEDPGHWTSLTLYAEELDNVSKFDLSKLVNVELIQVKFTFSPDSSESAKQVYRDSINVLMKNLAAFSKCPKLEKIVFCIGEQLYYDKKPPEEKDGYSERGWKIQFEENLNGAWRAFGKDVSAALPKVKLYAFTWGW